MGYPCVTLSFDQWPERDRLLWELANRHSDPFEPEGRGARWTEKTRRQVAKDYGRFLFWLAQNSQLDVDATPAGRATRVRLEAYLENLMATGMASTSLLSRMRALAQALGALDRIADLTALRGLCARLKSKASPTRQKHKRLTSPALLIDRALASYDEIACDAGSLPVRACTNARDALMLAFLAYIPIRLANFTNLTIGQHIHFSHGGAQLRLAASETKEHRAYTCAINPELVRYLEHYLSAVRPVLLDGTLCNRLWISMQNGSMADSAVYYQINKVTKRLIGYQINPHLIRDCVMTELAERSPEHVHAGAKLLGHRDLRTSEDHYNHASTLSAQRTYFKWIEDVRAGRHPSEKST